MEPQQQFVQQPQSAKRPLLPIGALFKKSFDTYYHTLFGIFTKLASINLLLLLVVVLVAGGFAIVVAQKHMGLAVAAGSLAAVMGIAIAVMVFLINASLFMVIKEKDSPMTVKQALAKGWVIVGPYAWVSILSGLAVMLGFILLIVPGIIFAVWYAFSVYAMVFEGQKGKNALKRSKELVKGYWWPVFGRLCLMFGISYLISRIPLGGFILGTLFVSPFAIVYHYYLYEDLKNIRGPAF